MSPLEVSREFEAARIRSEDEASARLHLAWHTARLTKMAMAGQLPELSEVLKPADGTNTKQPSQTRAEMKTVLRMLSEKLAIPFRKRTI